MAMRLPTVVLPSFRCAALRWCAAALVTVSASAGGQGAGVVATAWAGDAETRANAIYKEAKDRFEAKDFDKALELVTQAERIFAHPAITLLKGRALRAVGRLREAEEALKVVRDNLSQLPKPLVKVLTDEVLAVSEDMRKKGELVLQIEPSDARVTLDGVEVPANVQRWLAPGRHQIEATASGRRTVTREFELRAGDTTEVKLNLLQRDGRLAIAVVGGLQDVEVRLDGTLLELDAAVRLGDRVAPRDVSPGVHEVVCRKQGKQVGVQVKVAADATVEARCEGLPLPAQAAGAGRKAVGWSGVAVGAGLFGYGVYGLGSYLGSDLGDPRGIKSTNKHWLGSTYTVVGATAAVLSYLFLLRDEPATASAPTAVSRDRTARADD